MERHQVFSMKQGIRSIVLGVAITVLGGCAALDPRPPEEVLKERAQQRLDTLVAGDIAGAYKYLSPGSRAVMTSEAYATTIRPGFWKAGRVDRVTCESKDVCDVHLVIEYEHRGTRIKTPLKETWIKEGSSWWFVQK